MHMKSKRLLCVLSILSAVWLVSCSKNASDASANLANTNALKDITAEIKTGYSNFIPMAVAATATNLGTTNYTPIVSKMLATFETNVLSIPKSPGIAEISAGEEFLRNLKAQGLLPGISPDIHGHLTTGDFPLARYQEANYPFSVTFHFIPLDASYTNHYTVVRPSEGAEWQLEQAWQTDIEGHTVEDWPVK
jgi:hypothetical protein